MVFEIRLTFLIGVLEDTNSVLALIFGTLPASFSVNMYPLKYMCI